MFLFAGLDKFFMWASGTPFTAAGFLKFASTGAWLGSDPKASSTRPIRSGSLSPATPAS
jgi:hypothetical protein